MIPRGVARSGATPLLPVVALLGGCGTPVAPPPSTPVAGPETAPIPITVNAPTVPIDAPDAPLDAGYPADALAEAERVLGRACARLVYKRGCSELRHGRVELAVTLDALGVQTRVDVVANTVTRDPALVERCARTAIAGHRFATPAAPTTLTLVLVLADKC